MSSQRVRVLICHRSSLTRRLLRRAIGSEEQISVVADCAMASDVAELVGKHRPHVVVLDVTHPTSGAIELLHDLPTSPSTPVVIGFGPMTARTFESAIEALDAGAHDFVMHPPHVGSAAEALVRLRESLVPRILSADTLIAM